MNRRLSLLLLCLGVSGMLCARQKHAVGIHCGSMTFDIEYQYRFNEKNFLSATAGLFSDGEGIVAQGTYNWNIREWKDWTPHFATWKFWAGVGGGLGVYGEYICVGPAGTLGFGFVTKKVPLYCGVDLRPMLTLAVGDGIGCFNVGNIGLTLGYCF
ncbi:MAG: hypothetical protein K2N13_10200 [Paraprevotella sp.]|nr:hypothetical protein [Paraprevotella sp.]